MPTTLMREHISALLRSLRTSHLSRATARDLASERLAEEALTEDPSGIYMLMDWETRIRYRQTVLRYARCSGLPVGVVANRALAAARAATRDSSANPAVTHVGYFLIGPGAYAFRRSLERGPRATAYTGSQSAFWPRVTYGVLILLGILVQLSVVAYFAARSGRVHASAVVSIGLAGLPLFYVHAMRVAQAWLRWYFPPRILPKLAFGSGIPDSARTLVVVPTVLSSPTDARAQVARLAEHSSLNPGVNLRFALLSDFRDCTQQSAEGDEEILQALAQATSSLNAQHRDLMGDKFFALHRERSWNPGEGVWMGWERKRGKLQELNRGLRGAPISGHFRWVFGNLESFLAGYPVRYVLTLDDSTRLEEGEAAQLIRTASHPLNRPVVPPGAGRVTEGYGILQPSVVQARPPYLTRWNTTPFADRKLPPRTMRGVRASSTFDAFGNGQFIGKALYDVDAFRACLEDVLPPNIVLSHDLLEGLYVRTAEVRDAFIVEPTAGRHLTALRQRHRWRRGDTQLLRWVLPRVRDAQGGLRPNPLPLSARLTLAGQFIAKIAEFGRLGFLLLSWVLVPGAPLLWPAIAFAAQLSGKLRIPMAVVIWGTAGWAATLAGRRVPALAPYKAALANWLMGVFAPMAFLPLEAFVTADAVGRSLWRMTISHKHLLQWRAQHELEREPPAGLLAYLRFGWPSILTGLFMIPAVLLTNPIHLPVAIPLAALWTVAFAICWHRDGSKP